MPNHKSAEKQMRASRKANVRNRTARSSMRTAIKALTETKTKAEAEKAYKTAVSILDKNAKKGVIHKNSASNKKSRLSKYVNKFTTAKKPA